MVGKYKVITLCGSTRFKEEFEKVQKKLTLQGNIVISVGLFGHSGDAEVWESMDEGTLTETKRMLDDMHKRKIDMADEIFVINVGDYIGESTKSEIGYAKTHGKRVNYLEPHKIMFEEPTDHRAGAAVLWERNADRSRDDRSAARDTQDFHCDREYDAAPNGSWKDDSRSDGNLETLDAFMRNASKGPEYAEGYSPDEATAAILAYQNGIEEEKEEDQKSAKPAGLRRGIAEGSQIIPKNINDSGADEDAPDDSLTPDADEMKKAYALHMLHGGYDVANTAYFLDMDEADVQKILDEEGQGDGIGV